MIIEELVKDKPKKVYTLIIVSDSEEKTLLGYKKRGFASGYWNGFGGKVEEGETIEDGAKRELLEECGLKARSLTKLGILFFENSEWIPQLHEVHLFRTDEYEGEIEESEEMRPEWFKIDNLPFEKMLDPNKHWLPKALKGHIFNAFFSLKGQENALESFQMEDL